jgi:DNA-binding transcriptional MerR regulator
VTVGPTEWVLASKAAEILQVSPKTLSRWDAQGRLPDGVVLGRTLGGHRRYDLAKIRQLADTLRNYQPAEG